MAQATSYSQKTAPALTDEILLIDNAAAGAIKRATLAQASVDSGWQNAATYGTNIVADSAGGIQVRKIGKVVFIRGGIQAAASISAYDTVFTLPAGYYPAGVPAVLTTRYAGSETLRQITVSTGGTGQTMHSMSNTNILRVSGSWLID